MLGALVILLIGMSGVFIAAFDNNSSQGEKISNQLTIRDTTQKENLANSIEENEDDEGEDVAITGSALERASTVALAYIGEGRVTDSEISDEESYYEIEITIDDGKKVDVQLDENFNVVSTEWEDEEDDD